MKISRNNITNEIKNLYKRQQMRNKRYKAILLYITELLETIDENTLYNMQYATKNEAEKTFLNGTCNWFQYSFGGRSLCYDNEIEERLLTPSEQKHKHSSERLLREQAFALSYAFRLIYWSITQLKKI